MILIADTSGLLATIDADDPEHRQCRLALARASHVVISPLVMAELDYLTAKHFGEDHAISVTQHLTEQVTAGIYEYADLPTDLYAATHALRHRHRALKIGLTDAINVVLAARYSTNEILTLDRKHFRAIRPLGPHRGFRLLPDDME